MFIFDLSHIFKNYTNDKILFLPNKVTLEYKLPDYLTIDNLIYKFASNEDNQITYENTKNINDKILFKYNFKIEYLNKKFIKYNHNKINVNNKIEEYKIILRKICKYYNFFLKNIIDNFNYKHGSKHFFKFNYKNNNKSISSNYMYHLIDIDPNFLYFIKNKFEKYINDNMLLPKTFIEVYKNIPVKYIDNKLTCILLLFFLLEIKTKLYNFINYGFVTIKNIIGNPDILNISNTIFNNIPSDLVIVNDDISVINIKDYNCGIIYNNDNIKTCDYIRLFKKDNKWNLAFENIKNNKNIYNKNIIDQVNIKLSKYNDIKNNNKVFFNNIKNELFELIDNYIDKKIDINNV
jgi:hypothetical protein